MNTVLNLNARKLARLVSTWQTRLRLQDWDIRVQIVGPRSAPEEEASVVWDYPKKKATMKFASDAACLKDLTDSIVHELLHLHFWFVDTDNPTTSELLELAFTRVCDVIAEQDEQLSRKK